MDFTLQPDDAKWVQDTLNRAFEEMRQTTPNGRVFAETESPGGCRKAMETLTLSGEAESMGLMQIRTRRPEATDAVMASIIS